MPRLLPISIVLLAASTTIPAQTYTVLHYFGSKSGDPTNPALSGTISQSRAGAMLSTASSKAYRMSTNGSLQILHKFTDGWPYSGLTLARDGMYFGTTKRGGTYGFGTVFKMSQDGTVTTLYNFTGGSDGEYPYAPPIQSVEGDFYGTAAGNPMAEIAPYGSVYRITEDGNFTLLHAFSGSDGAGPRGPLVQGTDDRFYGTTNGGWPGFGTIFRISSTGDFKVLSHVLEFGGWRPRSALIQANDGNFYGLTREGGAGIGTLFRMTPAGVVTVLHKFSGGSDGYYPLALVQASDGNLYGTTEAGGANNSGVLFRATLAGDVVPLHDFDYATGAVPVALLQHTNGKLYGTTAHGGLGATPKGNGVFYSLDAGLPPFVTYLPTYGRPGAEVQILGQGFTADSVVSFNGTPAASMIVGYSRFIKAVVPDGATTGPITVTTSTGTLTSNKVFVVHPN